MKEVPLTQGYVALVDDSDYQSVSQFKWQAYVMYNRDGSVKNVYAARQLSRSLVRGRIQKMHRFLLEVSDPKVKVDHEDHNGLNNQRRNLRSATNADNQHNGLLSKSNTSGFKGVSWLRGKWQANITIDLKIKYLGVFTEVLDAARAYDAAAVQYFGQFAKTNAALGLL